MSERHVVHETKLRLVVAEKREWNERSVQDAGGPDTRMRCPQDIYVAIVTQPGPVHALSRASSDGRGVDSKGSSGGSGGGGEDGCAR